ncbi:MAG: flagellar brake protein [Alcaligenaceae bacterium]|nr:flagellar brake protein [Alcaligenaceae bacterium SAGV5]MPS51677.1 flagellar brake protein [Alcaligenaceae bacterium SAGV3]MPT59755.1 flagellar brake protein [Alcaligenaceae bacterium]
MREHPLLPLTPEPAGDASLEDFRISQPLEVLTLLGRMVEQTEVVALATADGVSCLSAIDGVDRGRRLLWLFGTAGDACLRSLLAAPWVVAVGYLDHVKIQFRVQNLQWLPGAEGSRLACLLPLELYRFQRRSYFRVRPATHPVPVVRARTGRADSPIELEVIDISMTGVGLLLRPGSPRFPVGARLPRATLVLGPATRLGVDLKVMHVTPRREPGQGHHMGCTLDGLDEDGLLALQHFISQAHLRQGGSS